MALKPVSPHARTKKKAYHPAPAPIVLVQKKKSGGSGLMMLLLLLVAAGGGYFVYSNQQKNEAALAAQQERREANAKAMAENERLREERDNTKAARRASASKARERQHTAMGTVGDASDDAYEQEYADDEYSYDESSHEEEEGTSTALGSTVKPKAGTGVYAVTDDSAPAFDLSATGSAEKKVANALKAAINKATKDNTYHDLLADLSSSLKAVDPELVSDSSSVPALPDESDKLLRTAQSIYTSLKLAADIEGDSSVSSDKHASFQSWLLQDKAKAARAFAQALDKNGVNDAAAAAKMMSKLRTTWLSHPTKAMGSIKKITKN